MIFVRNRAAKRFSGPLKEGGIMQKLTGNMEPEEPQPGGSHAKRFALLVAVVLAVVLGWTIDHVRMAGQVARLTDDNKQLLAYAGDLGVEYVCHSRSGAEAEIRKNAFIEDLSKAGAPVTPEQKQKLNNCVSLLGKTTVENLVEKRRAPTAKHKKRKR